MALLDTVPSQLRAADYVQRAARRYKGWKLYLGGHSKGGNLAVYSAVNCGKTVQNRIVAVYNNDGPGFRKTLMVFAPCKSLIAKKMLELNIIF